MKSQRESILNDDWDTLVVLDACRYDYFQSIYNKYVDGKLEKAISEGGCTPNWLKNTFKNEYFSDIVYVSANPYINSKGVDIGGFDGTKHFDKIIDVWESGWDDDLKTVPPQEVAKTTRMVKAKYPDKRIITHFMQPHNPYLSLGPIEEGISTAFRYASKEKEINESNSFIEKARGIAGQLMNKTIGWKNTQRLRKKINLTETIGAKCVESVAEKYGKNGLKIHYQKNLKKALIEIRTLVNRLPGKIIITSDHGELLGENGIYGHPSELNHSILFEVPWLDTE